MKISSKLFVTRNKPVNMRNQVRNIIDAGNLLATLSDVGGRLADLPPPPASVNPDYIQCPHCGRNFAPNVAERHIPKCVNIQAKPKPPPGMARMGTQQRMGGTTTMSRSGGSSYPSSSGGYGNSAAYPPPNRTTRGSRY